MIPWRWAGAALLLAAACDKSEPPAKPEPAAPAAATSAAKDAKPEASEAKADKSAAPAASEAAAEPSATASARAAKTAGAAASASAEAVASASAAPSSAPAEIASGTAASKPEWSAWLSGPKKVKVGEPVALSAVFTAAGKYHCNDQFPTSFKPDAAPAGVAFAADKFSGASFSPKRSSVAVSLTASSPGAKTVTGTLKFGVCDEANCIPVKAPVSFTFEAE